VSSLGSGVLNLSVGDEVVKVKENVVFDHCHSNSIELEGGGNWKKMG
jgi:hypothetical protein